MSFQQRVDDGQTLKAGLVALLLSGDPGLCVENSYILGFFHRGPDPLSPLSGPAHACQISDIKMVNTEMAAAKWAAQILNLSFSFKYARARNYNASLK